MNTYSNEKTRYGNVAILLHWVLALALVGLFVLGTYMADLPFSPQRLKLYNWHKWAGMTILALSAIRLLWRLTHPAPALSAKVLRGMPTWQVRSNAHTDVPAIFYSAAGGLVLQFGRRFPGSAVRPDTDTQPDWARQGTGCPDQTLAPDQRLCAGGAGGNARWCGYQAPVFQPRWPD